jgi:hypothetical protein
MMTTTVHPDMFTRVSYEFLQRLDKEAGAWLGQPKLNGHCVLVHKDGKTLFVQNKGGEEKSHIPTGQMALLSALLEDLEEVTVQAEFVGPRADYLGHMPVPRIEIVDCLRWRGEWLRHKPFGERLELLEVEGIPHLPAVESPLLCDLYAAQLTDPVSEGIVVRSATSGLVLHPDVCRVRSDWFKVKFRG